MVKDLINNFLLPQQIVGLDLQLLDDGTTSIHGVVLVKSKNQISIDQEFKVNEIAELKELFDTNYPVLLNIRGRGVLSKKVKNINDNEQVHLEQLLSNADLNQFEMVQHHYNEKEGYTTIVRKDLIEGYLDELNTLELSIIGLELGLFALETVRPMVSGLAQFQQFNIAWKESLIDGFSKTEELIQTNFVIEGETIKQDYFLAYSIALKYFIFDYREIPAMDSIGASKKEFVQKKHFAFRGWGIMIATFAIVLVNYLYFNHYFTGTQELESLYYQNQNEYKQLEKLKKRISETEFFVQETGWNKMSQTAFYADQIAHSAPRNIQLTDVWVHPIKEQKNKFEKREQYDANTISIVGVCQQSSHLNDWIFSLKTEEWLSDLKINNYIKRSSDDVDVFELILEVN